MKKSIACFLVLFSPLAVSGQVQSTISQVGAASNDYGVIRIDSVISKHDLPPCAQKASDGLSSKILSWKKSGPDRSHGKDLLTIALAGFVNRKNLVITFSKTECGLHGVRPLVTRIDLIENQRR